MVGQPRPNETYLEQHTAALDQPIGIAPIFDDWCPHAAIRYVCRVMGVSSNPEDLQECKYGVMLRGEGFDYCDHARLSTGPARDPHWRVCPTETAPDVLRKLAAFL